MQIKPGSALYFLATALGLLCATFIWYLWRVHGDASSYPFCGECSCCKGRTCCGGKKGGSLVLPSYNLSESTLSGEKLSTPSRASTANDASSWHDEKT